MDKALRVLGAGPWIDSMPQDLDDGDAMNFLIGAARCTLLFASDPRYSKTAEAYSDYWRMYFANRPRPPAEQEPPSSDAAAGEE